MHRERERDRDTEDPLAELLGGGRREVLHEALLEGEHPLVHAVERLDAHRRLLLTQMPRLPLPLLLRAETACVRRECQLGAGRSGVSVVKQAQGED